MCKAYGYPCTGMSSCVLHRRLGSGNWRSHTIQSNAAPLCQKYMVNAACGPQTICPQAHLASPCARLLVFVVNEQLPASSLGSAPGCAGYAGCCGGRCCCNRFRFRRRAGRWCSSKTRNGGICGALPLLCRCLALALLLQRVKMHSETCECSWPCTSPVRPRVYSAGRLARRAAWHCDPPPILRRSVLPVPSRGFRDVMRAGDLIIIRDLPTTGMNRAVGALRCTNPGESSSGATAGPNGLGELETLAVVVGTKLFDVPVLRCCCTDIFWLVWGALACPVQAQLTVASHDIRVL